MVWNNASMGSDHEEVNVMLGGGTSMSHARLVSDQGRVEITWRSVSFEDQSLG